MAVQIKAACGTYIRALLTILLTLMATIGKSPNEFSGEEIRRLLGVKLD